MAENVVRRSGANELLVKRLLLQIPFLLWPAISKEGVSELFDYKEGDGRSVSSSCVSWKKGKRKTVAVECSNLNKGHATICLWKQGPAQLRNSADNIVSRRNVDLQLPRDV